MKNGFEQLDELLGGALLEATSIEEAMLARRAGASAIILTMPFAGGVRRAVDDQFLVTETRRAIRPIPLMVRIRVGHVMEAEQMEYVVDILDESELLSVADQESFLNKRRLEIPVMCGCRTLAEALLRVHEGASLLRVQGDSSSADIAHTVYTVKSLFREIESLASMTENQLMGQADAMGVPSERVLRVKDTQEPPVKIFASGGILTAVDAALMLRLGCHGVIISSDIFKGQHGFRRAKEIVRAVHSESRW